METRALNICQSGPPLEYVEDLEEEEAPIWTCEVEYEQGDRLFVIRILSESTMEDVRATFMTSQKLTHRARHALEA